MPSKKKQNIIKEKQKAELISSFARHIENLLNTEHKEGTYMNIYTEIVIDGLPVDILIEKQNSRKYKLKIKVKNDIIKLNDDNTDYEICLLVWSNFNTLEKLLETIEIIERDFKLIDHTFLSPEQIEDINIKRTLFPMPSDKTCSVCNTPTVEYTVCKHPICFKCRYNCIDSNMHTCPICNFGKLNLFPNELIYHDP